MKYEAGQKVKIKSLGWYNANRDEYGYVDCGSREFSPKMSDLCGKIATIKEICKTNCYHLEEYGFDWTEEMIECKVEDTITTNEQLFELSNMSLEKEMEWNLPEGYQFVDENGNVINAQKIVLEKKKKEVILTQEQIDTMVHESCVLFCKHCGCGVPRETCTSLGTCKDHDEYRKCMRTYFEKHKE